ncbi:MAG: serine protease [Ideonella sp.]|nr:serine protease [Ideonella sp.]
MFLSASWKAMGLALLSTVVVNSALAEDVTPLRAKVAAHQWALAQQVGMDQSPQGDFNPLVVGGTPAAPGSWPFFVALMDSKVASNVNAQFCGGSLISPRHVLTAAHCVEGTAPSQIQILVGTLSLLEGGRRVNTTAITVHPKYRSQDFDVAVIELAEAVNDITPVKFVDSAKKERKVASPDAPTMAMGYGTTRFLGRSSNIVLEVEMPVVDRAVCNGANSYNGDIGKTEICAGLMGVGGKDTCQGDSGGPLVAKGKAGAFDTQVGVVSWGNGCGKANYPGVYARLGTLGAWVRAQISAR